ncbi:aspartate aminotransferase family protein [Pseudohalocynthiibacter aestuariivivens]|uniref:Aspartate aminotransferase family protein n=1 Tax=Roseovarius pelagicus TaxID=2980108 RepID=A0ABY6DBZ3_9RHOB|nr:MULTISPECIES: aspartate aminotransferase family protein [Rhodobacterales]QIE44482.1 aspartate aminotransferase family protein [Pseudohalocynthiibacter aestuariivivens]UXX83618.1 aspartate aminotransferase family protein [Roseovarius pelagicus]
MKTEKSAKFFDRAMKVLVEGCSSASRGPLNYSPHPSYFKKGQGARLWDVDDNEFIDWQLSFGCLPLGHAHPKIVEVIREQVENGTHFATALEIEVEVAEMMVAMLGHVDKVRFANTGTEACMTAVRMARGITGKRKVLKFEGHYHGWYDGLLVSSNPQPVTTLGHPNDPVRIPDSSGLTPGSWEDTLVSVWNDIDALERILKIRGHEIACVMMEGAMSNMGVIPAKDGYLKQVQELCRKYDVLFYLDETVTGFRVAPGGAAELYGLQPDIVTYGKALGQGFPVAAIAGPDHIMESIEYGKVLHYGSHNAPRLGLYAVKAMLEEMTKDDNAGFRKITEIGEQMTTRLNAAARDAGQNMRVQNIGSMFHPVFTDLEEITGYRDFCASVDLGKYAAFAAGMREEGVFFTGNKILHNLSCTAHTQEDIDVSIAAATKVLHEMPK